MKMYKKLMAIIVTIALIVSMVPMSATSVFANSAVAQAEGVTDNASEVLVLGEEKSVSIGRGKTDTQWFTPSEDGWYVFYTQGDYDTIGALYNSLGSNIANGDDDGDGYNYRIVTSLSAGETYHITSRIYNQEPADITLKVEKLPSIQSVDIVEEGNMEGYPFDSRVLYVEISPEENVAPESLVWTSSNEDVIGVEVYDNGREGNITFLKPGTTTLTVTSESGASDSIEITVKEFPAISLGEVKSVALSESEYEKYGYCTFTPEEDGWYAFSSICNKIVYCEMLDTNGETIGYDYGDYIDNNFSVEGYMSAGTTYIFKCMIDGNVGINSYDVKIEKMTSPTSMNIEQGEGIEYYVDQYINLSVEFGPDGCAEEVVNWTSDNEEVATVDIYGQVSLLKAGNAVITATSQSGLTDEFTVKVLDYPAINLNEQKTFAVDYIKRFGFVTFTPKNDGVYEFCSISEEDILARLYNSNGSQIAFDDDSGEDNNFKIQCELKAGQTYLLKCEVSPIYSTHTFGVKVIERLEAKEIHFAEGETFSAYVNTYHTFKFNYYPENSMVENYHLTSSDESVASAESYGYSSGYVEFNKIGTATITVLTENGLTDSIEVTVLDYPEIELDETKSIECTADNRVAYHKFTPSEDGLYDFHVSGDSRVKVSITTLDGEYIGSFTANDSYLSYELSAGTAYYITTGFYYDSSVGNYEFRISNTTFATQIEIEFGDYYEGYVGQNSQLYIKFYPEKCQREELTWQSDNTNVVTVDNDGYITYVGAGTATITVTSERGLTDSVTVISKVRPSATSISISGNKVITGFPGVTASLWVYFSPYDCEKEELTWTSSDESVVTVSGFASGEGAEINLVGAGTATVTVTTENGLSDSCTVQVVGISDITLNQEFEVDMGVNVGKRRFSFIPTEDGTYAFRSKGYFDVYGTIYDSEMNSLAYDDDSGEENNFFVYFDLVAGTQYYFDTGVYVWDSTISNFYTVEVVKLTDADSIEIVEGATYSGYIYDEYTFTAKLGPDNCFPEEVYWTTSNENIVSVDYDGSVRMCGVGTATITAYTDSGLSDSIEVTVQDFTDVISVGDTKNITITEDVRVWHYKFTANDGDMYNFTFEGDNLKFFKILNSRGELQDEYETYKNTLRIELSQGVTYYIVTGFVYEDAIGEYTMELEKTPAATSVHINYGESYIGYEGTEIYFSAYLKPDYCIPEEILWSSSDEDVVYINSYGNANFVGGGTAIITATTTNGLTATCTVTVQSMPSVYLNQEIEPLYNEDRNVIYAFIPTEDGTYGFLSNGNYDTSGYIYDADMNLLKSDSDSGEDENFSVVCDMVAGNKYYLKTDVNYYGDLEDIDTTIKVIKLTPATSIEIREGETFSGYLYSEHTLDVDFAPYNAIPETLYWRSSDSSVVSVAPYYGAIKLNGIGTATITVTSASGFSDSIEVTVTDCPEIELNETKNVEITEDIRTSHHKFIPSEDGVYSILVTEGMYRELMITDVDGNRVYSIFTSNNAVGIELTANTVYYIVTGPYYANSVGNYDIRIEKTPDATSISISGGTSRGFVGEKYYLSAYFEPDDCLYQDYYWSSSDDTVATVDEDGMVNFVGAGTATITVTSEKGLTDSLIVTVVDIAEISIDEEIELDAADQDAKFTFVPEEDGVYGFYLYGDDLYKYGYIYDEYEEYITGHSGYDFVVYCDMVAQKQYYFVAKPCEENQGTYYVKVSKLTTATSLEITNGDTLSGYLYESHYLTAKLNPDNAIPEYIEWHSSNEEIVVVNSDGSLFFKGIGTATVTAMSENGLTDSITITVDDSFEEIGLDDERDIYTSADGEKTYFKFIPEVSGYYTFSLLCNEEVNYKQLSIVNADGVYVANYHTLGGSYEFELNAGERYYITTGMLFGAEGGYTFVITKTPLATSVQISEYETVGYVGDRVYLDAIFYPEHSAYEEVIWSSSNEDVATVDENGRVSYIGIGTATITVTSENGLTDSYELCVKDVLSINCDEEILLDGSVDAGIGVYSFVPESDGYYVFYSYDNDFDVRSYLYNEEMQYIEDNDDGGDEDNFRLLYYLTADTQYYFKASPCHTDELNEGTYCIKLAKLVMASSLEILEGESISMGLSSAEHELNLRFGPENSVEEEYYLTSSNEDVIEILDGLTSFRLVSIGTATITVTTENGLTDSITITVTSANEITADERFVGRIGGEYINDTLVFVPDEDACYEISLESSNDFVMVLYDSNGNQMTHSIAYSNSTTYQNLTAGEKYYIIVRFVGSNGGVYYANITKLTPATSMEISNGESFTGYIGDKFYLTLDFTPENCIHEECMWYSSDESVVTVDSGELYLANIGTAVITVVSESGLTDSIVITVTAGEPATEMDIKGNDIGFVGTSNWLYAEFEPYNAAPESITWESDDETIATVSENGEVTFLSTGVVNITATSENGLTDTIEITVKEPVSLIEGQSTTIYLESDDEALIEYVATEDSEKRIYVSEASNKNTIMLVLCNSWGTWLASSTYGYIDYDFVEGETYYIYAHYYEWFDGQKGSFSLDIEELVSATSISIDLGTEYSNFVGTEVKLNVHYEPLNAIHENIIWTSTDSDIVSVDEDGYITLLKVGTATITASTESGITAQIEITVEDFPTITEGQSVSVKILIGEGPKVYYFTPSVDGYYTFYSYNSGYDTFANIYDAEWNEIAYDDDSGEVHNFRIGQMLEGGKTYILSVYTYDDDQDVNFDIKIEQSRYVTNMEVVSTPTKIEYVEGYAGKSMEFDGLKIKFTWSDGNVTNWTYEGDWYVEGERIFDDLSDADDTGIVTFYAGECSVSIQLTLIDNPVDHIELVTGASHTYIENYGGYYAYDNSFYYNTNYPSDTVIKVVYKDGTSVNACVGSYVDGYYIDWEDTQYKKPWTVGTDNESIIYYLGHEVVLPITVKENTVASIEAISGITCYENANGYVNEYGNYCYTYDLPYDLKFKISYTDGTYKTVGLYEEIDGYYICSDDRQYEEPWTKGGENYIYVSYLNVEGKIPVTILENPVDSIKINTAPTREYVYGDMDYGYLYNGIYELYPTDLTGLSFTVYYKDGTSKTYTYEDIDEDSKIDGAWYELRYDIYAEIGENTVTFEYMGKTDEYTLTVKESNVASIEIIKAPDKTEFDSNYMPDFVGMQLRITYVDNTTKLVTVTEDNVSYYVNFAYGTVEIRIDVDGYNLIIRDEYYSSSMTYKAYYLDASCEVDCIELVKGKKISNVDIENANIDGEDITVNIKYFDNTTETYEVENIYSKLYGTNNANVGITKYGILVYVIEEEMKEGEVVGYRVYILDREIYIENDDGTNDNPDQPEEIKLGDINSDNSIDTVDLALLKLYLAGASSLSDAELAAADIDGNDTIDTVDLAKFKLYLAGAASLV